PPPRNLRGGRLLRFLPVIALIGFVLEFGRAENLNRKWIDLVTEAMYLAVAAAGVNILLGYTGLLSLGHAAFFVAGGYMGAILSPAVGIPAWAGFVFAFFGAALLGSLLALMCCHLRGFYLTVVTLGFGALVPAVVVVAKKQLGGPAGRAVEKFVDTTKVPLAGHGPYALQVGTPDQSFRYVVMVVVGGMGTLAGPVLGAFGFSFAFGVSWVQNTFRDYQGLLYGATGLFAVATAPEGTVGNLRRYLRWFDRR